MVRRRVQRIGATARRRSTAEGWPARERARPATTASRRQCRTRPNGGTCCSSCPPNRLSSSANLGARNGFPARLFEGKPFQGIEHEIGCLHLGQTTVSRLGAGKAPVRGELVDRFAAATNAEILAALPAHLDAHPDVS